MSPAEKDFATVQQIIDALPDDTKRAMKVLAVTMATCALATGCGIDEAVRLTRDCDARLQLGEKELFQ